MSVKTLIIATAALAASTAMTVPSFAAAGDGTGPTGNPPPAATQQLPVRGTIMFNLLDTNHDGAVDQNEFAAVTNATFTALDTDKDGKLTADELSGRFGAMMGQRGGRGGPGMGWDRDDRGGRGQARMAFNRGPQGAGPRVSFDDIDTNHDGPISQDEFQAHQRLPGQGRGLGPRR